MKYPVTNFIILKGKNLKIEHIKGLHAEIEGENIISISHDANFESSRIIIKGDGNNIKIGGGNFKSFVLNLIGNNKKIIIKKTKKNISNLKITSIRADNQKVIIEEDFGCGGCEVQMNDGDETLFIGKDCLFSWNIKIRTSDGHSVIDLKSGQAINLPSDVEIGNHVWICEDVKILKGVKVPDNSIVATSAVLTKRFEETNILLGGFPANIIKRGVTWDRRMPYQYNKSIKKGSK